MSDICTIPANIAGLPAISVPSGMSNNLPIGLQFMGPQFGDKKILQIAYNFEKTAQWNKLNLLKMTKYFYKTKKFIYIILYDFAVNFFIN